MAADDVVALQAERLDQPVMLDLRLNQRVALVEAVDDVLAGGVAEPDERVIVAAVDGVHVGDGVDAAATVAGAGGLTAVIAALVADLPALDEPLLDHEAPVEARPALVGPP